MVRRALTAVCLATAVGCGSDGSTAVPSPTGPTDGSPSTTITFPGLDAANYPGDAAMRAWLYPSSPYFWTGYYLAAPCHRDVTWTGRRATLAAMGWGITAIYVGQQDWTQIPTASARRAVDIPRGDVSATASGLAVTCSASLLSAAQGSVEAADAIDKMSADGFPSQSIVFLDVEYVTAVTPPLLEYYRAWIGAVLADNRYRPGVYAAKSNATALYAAATAEYSARGHAGAPPFWIAGSAGFSISAKPTAVGFDFAELWQGLFDVTQSWNGVSLVIDVDVASTKSPSSP